MRAARVCLLVLFAGLVGCVTRSGDNSPPSRDDVAMPKISSNRQWWNWSQGTAFSNGDWNLKKPKEVAKFLDELLK